MHASLIKFYTMFLLMYSCAFFYVLPYCGNAPLVGRKVAFDTLIPSGPLLVSIKGEQALSGAMLCIPKVTADCMAMGLESDISSWRLNTSMQIRKNRSAEW